METELIKLEDLPPVIEAWGREYKKGAVMWEKAEDTKDGYEITVVWTSGESADDEKTQVD